MLVGLPLKPLHKVRQSMPYTQLGWMRGCVLHDLYAVALLVLLGGDLKLETADLSVQTLGRAGHLHALCTDLRCLGNQRLAPDNPTHTHTHTER